MGQRSSSASDIRGCELTGQRRGLRLGLALLALRDMVEEKDWERVIELCEGIQTEARARIIEQELAAESLKRRPGKLDWLEHVRD